MLNQTLKQRLHISAPCSLVKYAPFKGNNVRFVKGWQVKRCWVKSSKVPAYPLSGQRRHEVSVVFGVGSISRIILFKKKHL